MYSKYKSKGLEILAFPCNQFGGQEPGTNSEIKAFAQSKGARFPLFAKIEVNGDGADPLYKWLKKEKGELLSADIKWNFAKFLLNREGKVVNRYAPPQSPLSFENDVADLLK